MACPWWAQPQASLCTVLQGGLSAGVSIFSATLLKSFLGFQIARALAGKKCRCFLHDEAGMLVTCALSMGISQRSPLEVTGLAWPVSCHGV